MISNVVVELSSAAVMPTVALMSPGSAETLRLQKNSTNEYLLGYPASAATPMVGLCELSKIRT
jgi:hypothetical protein